MHALYSVSVEMFVAVLALLVAPAARAVISYQPQQLPAAAWRKTIKECHNITVRSGPNAFIYL